MTRIVLFTLIGLFITTNNLAQEQEIEMKMNFWGYRFMKDGKRLNWKELEEATVAVENANLLIKQARNRRTTSIIMSVVGGGLLGWSIGQNGTKDDPDYTLAYIGGAISATSLGYSISTFNKVNKGVDTYNLTVNKTAHYQFQPELYLSTTSNGIGFSLRF